MAQSPLSAERASTIADQLRETLLWGENFLRKHPETAYLAKNIFDASAASALDFKKGVDPKAFAGVGLLSKEKQRELIFTMQDVQVRKLWQQTRIVYDVDPDAMESIGDAQPDSVVPKEVLLRLPHPNPLVVFPEPILIDHGEKERQRVVAVYVNGAIKIDEHADGHARTMLCSTSNPLITGWSLQFAGIVETSDGKTVMNAGMGRPDVMWTRASVLLDKNKTLGELAAEATSHFNAITGSLAFGDPNKDVPLMLARAINLLVYLGAMNADLQPLPPSSQRRTSARGGSKAKPPKVLQVGFRVGAQLRAWTKRQQEDGSRAGVGKGGTKAPHIRRSHPHTYPVPGTKRQEKYVRWMWPIPVKMDLGPDKNTVTPIKKI
jgi:hypothetical protein